MCSTGVYGLVAPIWEQAKVLADHITGHKSDSAYLGSKISTRLKVMGVEVASMGITEPTEEGDEVVQFTEPKKGTYKTLIVHDSEHIVERLGRALQASVDAYRDPWLEGVEPATPNQFASRLPIVQ